MFGVYYCQIYKLLINDIKYIISLYHYQKNDAAGLVEIKSHIVVQKCIF